MLRQRALPGLCVLALAVTAVKAAPGTPARQETILGSLDFSRTASLQETLPEGLNEVSGLATSPDGRLFAHGDERAVIYELAPDRARVLKWFVVGRRGVMGDFEGLAIMGHRFFLVTSQGELVEFREGEAGAEVRYNIHLTGVGRLCEVEGLAYDPDRHTLLMPCKVNRTEEFEGHVVVVEIRGRRLRAHPVPRVFLPLDELERVGMDAEFHPSAIEIHPETGALIVASAQEEALLELTTYGRLLAGHSLRRRDHPQTEGVAFGPNGSLVLADEGQGARGRLTWYFPDGGGSP